MLEVRRMAVAVAVLALVAGCAPSGPDDATIATAHSRATKVLENWSAAVKASGGRPAVVPVGSLTGQVGDWEEPFGDNAKRALMAGLVTASAGLTATSPATATVTWADGSTAPVRVIGAQDALAAIGRSPEPGATCSDCVALEVVSATLVIAPITTTRGPATGPVWEFAMKGTAVRVTRIAVADAVTVAPMLDEPGGALAIDSAASSVSSVTVRFVGAPDPASKPCGEDYTADAVESDLAVTVLVWRHANTSLLPAACTAVGALRTATATLARPLGDRPVLDPATGQPVTLTLTP